MTEQNRNRDEDMDRDRNEDEGSEAPNRQPGQGSHWQNPAGTTQQGGQGSTYGQGGGMGEGGGPGEGRPWQSTEDDELDETERTGQEQGTTTPR